MGSSHLDESQAPEGFDGSSTSELTGDGLEAAHIARALALKLGSRQVGLWGCAADSITRVLTAQLRPVRIESEGDDSTELSGGIAMIATHLLLSGEIGDRLPGVLSRVCAAVVMDPDGVLGIDDMPTIVGAAHDAGVTVVHKSFVRGSLTGDVSRSSPLLVISDGHDPRPARLLAAGARSLAFDPRVDLEQPDASPARICIASYEVAGPTRNGGIATANTSLAIALAHGGHDVTLLFTGTAEPARAQHREEWVRRFARENVSFELLPTERVSAVKSPHPNVRRAFELYRWLRDREDAFDVVHFPECQGHAYFAVLARAQGLAFARTTFVAGVHSCTRWCSEANRELPRSVDALVDEHLEQLSVELADVVVSPSAYMLDYLTERGWALPPRRFVQQYVLPPSSRHVDGGRPAKAGPIEEIVFFGRLEVRKGIETFCDALDQIAAADPARRMRITFLGRPEHVLGEPAVDYVTRRARSWPWPHQLLGELDQDQAMAHLRRGGCLAVMPSTVDNSPNTVSETLSIGIPTITSRSGGTGELIDPLDLHRCTFAGLDPPGRIPPIPVEEVATEMSSEELAERITAALDAPFVPRLAIDHAACERIHVEWNAGVASAPAPADNRSAESAGVPPAPTVTVGLLHRDRSEALIKTLEALVSQRDQLLDVVVVDDASHGEPAASALKRAEEICAGMSWTLLRRDRPNAGQARAQMLAAGRGELFMFLTCAESPSDNALRLLRQVASWRAAGIFTWPVADPYRRYRGRFESPDDPAPRGGATPMIVPIAGPALVGASYPAFSIGSFAIRRSVLDEIGGFAPDARGSEADADVLNRALLTRHRIEVISEPLTIALEADPWARLRAGFSVESAEFALDREQAVRLARPFARLLPPTLRDLAGLHMTSSAKSAEDRLRAIDEYKQLDNRRHAQAEYIEYLEREHRMLSARVRPRGWKSARLMRPARALVRRIRRRRD